MKQIFPKEIIDNTVEVHRFKHSLKSKIIYGIVLLSIIGIGASLPFVFLDIYSSVQGVFGLLLVSFATYLIVKSNLEKVSN